MQTRFVKPAAGKCVRDPETKQPLPPDGARVQWSTFWSRREKEGAIVVGSDAAPRVTNQTGGKK